MKRRPSPKLVNRLGVALKFEWPSVGKNLSKPFEIFVESCPEIFRCMQAMASNFKQIINDQMERPTLQTELSHMAEKAGANELVNDISSDVLFPAKSKMIQALRHRQIFSEEAFTGLSIVA